MKKTTPIIIGTFSWEKSAKQIAKIIKTAVGKRAVITTEKILGEHDLNRTRIIAEIKDESLDINNLCLFTSRVWFAWLRITDEKWTGCKL